jgi:SAM-dependent methyltransferase
MSSSGITKMSNYEFCAQWVIDKSNFQQVRVLDYGCGRGEIVRLLRAKELESFGCDVFYEGADYLELKNDPLFGTAILKMNDGKIPFEDDYFDFIVSNQVIEHVEDLDATLAEFKRVLKQGGQILTIFPDKSSWYEGHCDIPFLHWFPKGSKPRVYYAFLLRSIGMGSFKGDKSPMQWSQDICIWLDTWTHYRSPAEIDSKYSSYFSEIESIELLWVHQRLGSRKWLISWLPKVIQQTITKKFAGRAIVVHNL